jgi:tetratricopeptide (TPR) repeat protein
MSPPRLLVSALIAVTAVACASAGGMPDVPATADIPRLEAAVAADPGDVDSGLRLAAGYRGAERYEEARAIVTGFLESAPEDPGLLAMTGLLAEDLGDLVAARSAYQAIVEGGRGGALLEAVERRLELVRRAELRAQVAEALDREDQLAQTAPDPATVGVFPFRYEGADPNWEPLALALPEMLSTDLAVTGRLQVLERLHVQALLDELALGASGRVDQQTAARSGRLLGSGNIVQGTVRVPNDALVGVDAAVVEVGRAGDPQVDPLTAEDAMERVFTLEKQLALDLHSELGIQLTPAERERINERQTESVQALLEFGRGIAAENAGDYTQARQHFAAAANLDPGFAMAHEHRDTAGRLAEANLDAVPAQVSSTASRVATQRQAVNLLRNAPSSLRDRVLQNLGAQKRAVIQEVLGQDRVGQTVLLELIFTLQGGEE